MAGFIGNKPGAKYATLTRQSFSSPTGTSHTLSQTVTNSDDLLLYINNVKQNPADYTASGTTLTTASLAGGTEMYCLYYGKTTETVAVPSDSVDSSHIVDDAIDSEHYTDGSIDNVHLATGIDASKLTTGTLPMARLSGTLPALNGSALTNLPSTYSLIHNSTTAGASRAFTGMSRTTYTMGWWIYFNNVYPSTAGDIELLVSGDDGSSYHNAYTYTVGGHDWDGATLHNDAPTIQTEIVLNLGTVWNIAPAGMSGWIFIPQSLTSANVDIVWSMGSMENSSSDKERYSGMGACDNSVVDINAFKFIASNGSNVNGHIQVYGLKPS